MKRFLKLLTLLAVLAAVVSVAGCSPTIATWADRGEIGCDNERTAADAWRDLALGYIDVHQSASIADVFTDIRAVTASNIFEKGLDGEPVVLDDAWLDEAHVALEATLAGLAKRRAAVDEMHARHLANIAATREAFAQIRRLNTAWASLAGSDLPAQMGRLIEELRRERINK